MDGELSYTEVMKMSNQARKRWLTMMEERAAKQKEEAEKAKAKGASKRR